MAAKFNNKVVISTTNLKSQSLKRLANELSTELGYRVYRVLPKTVVTVYPVFGHSQLR